MKPLPHQVEKSLEVYNILQDKGIVYLAGAVRSGKTLTVILAAEKTKAKNILVLTKKAAISGWHKFDDNMTKNYHITNYEQAHKLLDKSFDLVIVDESHANGQVGKPSLRVKNIRKLAYDLPVILMSGTPHIETKASLYHQMCITKYSPFYRYPNFYRFFDQFGIITTQWMGGVQRKVYKTTRPELDAVIDPYFVTMTQADAGIEHTSQEQVHYIDLSEGTKEIYNKLMRDRIAVIDGERVVCDTDMKLRMTLHQLETGEEKFKYIEDHFPTGKVGVMSHFITERTALAKRLPYVEVYSSNKHKEGVDLSHLDHFIILSGDYSGAGHAQRIERNVNINNTKAAVVHHLLVKDGISDQVFKAVSNKRDFNNKTFKKVRI